MFGELPINRKYFGAVDQGSYSYLAPVTTPSDSIPPWMVTPTQTTSDILQGDMTSLTKSLSKVPAAPSTQTLILYGAIGLAAILVFTVLSKKEA